MAVNIETFSTSGLSYWDSADLSSSYLGKILIALESWLGDLCNPTLGTITPGSGYTDGTYENIELVNSSSEAFSGKGLKATVVVASGAVTTVTRTSKGYGFETGDSLELADAASLGTGTGFRVLVASANPSPALIYSPRDQSTNTSNNYFHLGIKRINGNYTFGAGFYWHRTSSANIYTFYDHGYQNSTSFTSTYRTSQSQTFFPWKTNLTYRDASNRTFPAQSTVTILSSIETDNTFFVVADRYPTTGADGGSHFGFVKLNRPAGHTWADDSIANPWCSLMTTTSNIYIYGTQPLSYTREYLGFKSNTAGVIPPQPNDPYVLWNEHPIRGRALTWGVLPPRLYTHANLQQPMGFTLTNSGAVYSQYGCPTLYFRTST